MDEEGRSILVTLKWHSTMFAVMTLAFLGLASSTLAQVEPKASTWKTHVLASGSALRLPPPPDTVATQAELVELRTLASRRDAAALDQISYWDAGWPGYRWTELGMSWGLKRFSTVGPFGNYRLVTLLGVAMYDATIAAWDSKYAYNRPRPHQTDPSVSTVVATPASPAYPSEHAVVAGAAAAVLAYLMPQDAPFFMKQAEVAARSRVLTGVQYPSDVKAGLDLGRAVGAKVVERAKQDKFDPTADVPIPAGPGKWVGSNPNVPKAGSWRTWLVPWDGQPSVGPPPAYDSPEVAKELAEMKAFKPTGQPNAIFWPDDPAGRPVPGSAPIATDQIAYHYAKLNHLLWVPQLHQKLFEYRWDANPPRAARALALVSIAHYDTVVACWGTRYVYWYARPVHLDPTITPTFTTPNQPAYPSGHSCIEGATSRVLAYLFPREAAVFESRAEELAKSRWWSKIHYTWDNNDGLKLGRGVADKVIRWAKADGAQ
jgi:membrane-associated phospholipid phosphatase